MIVTVSMRAKTRKLYRKSSKKPDYNYILPEESLIDIFDNGRCARIDVSQDKLEDLKSKFGDKFVFSRNIILEPY